MTNSFFLLQCCSDLVPPVCSITYFALNKSTLIHLSKIFQTFQKIFLSILRRTEYHPQNSTSKDHPNPNFFLQKSIKGHQECLGKMNRLIYHLWTHQMIIIVICAWFQTDLGQFIASYFYTEYELVFNIEQSKVTFMHLKRWRKRRSNARNAVQRFQMIIT